MHSIIDSITIDLSKEEIFTEFHGKIHFKDIYEYALSKVVKPTSIDVIRGIIGGPNTIYKCLPVDQSYYVYYFCKNNLLDVVENTKWPILLMEDWSTDEMDGLMVVTFKPRMYNNREHLVLWGCLRMSLNTHPKVAISCAFDITGVYHFHKYLSAAKHFLTCTKAYCFST